MAAGKNIAIAAAVIFFAPNFMNACTANARDEVKDSVRDTTKDALKCTLGPIICAVG